jgi:hypothetical protein
MTLWTLAAVITLTAFALVAAAASLLVRLAAPAIARRLEGEAPSSRAAIFFRLRVLPAAAAFVMAFGIALPVFFWFEPADTRETVAGTLIVTGSIGFALLARAAARGTAALRATARLRRDWLHRGRRLEGFDTPLPVYAIDEAFPAVAVIGFARPALFIADRVVRECTADEVRAMVRHECAHVSVHDNLKRLLIRACPDLPAGLLDRAWACAAEEAADAAAAAEQPGCALDLASALIRVARLAPVAPAPAIMSAFYGGGSIESRVRRLLEDRPAAARAGIPRSMRRILAAALVGLLASTVALAAPAMHQAMESIVSVLP